MQCVSKLVENQVQPILQSVPVASKEFYLSPWNFDFSERSKYGEKGRWPTNLQYKAHFQSFLKSGYEASREPIDVRFREHSDIIEPFSVQFVDGQNKLLIIQSILALMEDIKESEVEEDPHFATVLASLANRRSEKVKPSCLDFVLVFREAARIKHEATPHMSLRDCVWGAVSEYNKTVSKARALDSELRSHIRGNDPMFDISKLAFFAEATGAVQESHILEAQNNVANARKTSLQAGFALFKTSLSNDQVLHDRFLAASKTDEARARSAALGSLEAVVWFIVSFFCHVTKERAPGADSDKEKVISTIAAKVNPWLTQVLMGYAGGLRRPESERIFGWCNYVTAGVLTAGKIEFTVNTITGMAHAYPRQFVAVVMLPNRSGDLRLPMKYLE
eukprot:s1200_g5.t1